MTINIKLFLNISLTLPIDEESKNSKKGELKRIMMPSSLNGYSRKLITSLIVKQRRKKIASSPEELVRTFFEYIGQRLLP